MGPELSTFLSDVEPPSDVEVCQLLSAADSFNLVPLSPSSMINEASLVSKLSTCSTDIQEAFQYTVEQLILVESFNVQVPLGATSLIQEVSMVSDLSAFDEILFNASFAVAPILPPSRTPVLGSRGNSTPRSSASKRRGLPAVVHTQRKRTSSGIPGPRPSRHPTLILPRLPASRSAPAASGVWRPIWRP